MSQNQSPGRRSRPVVAIDGPAGAGKSTVTRLLADSLGYTRVDTGALYRTVALACSEAGVSFDDDAGAGEVARQLAEPCVVELTTSGQSVTVQLRGRDVSAAIRTQEMGQGASRVSALPAVRAALLDLQRQLGRAGGVVLEGRDIGSVVFPDAEIKFFLTASVRVRAERRLRELLARGESADLATIEREVEERDHRDSTRAAAPLVCPPGAVIVDSSEQTIEEVVSSMRADVEGVALRLGGIG